MTKDNLRSDDKIDFEDVYYRHKEQIAELKAKIERLREDNVIMRNIVNNHDLLWQAHIELALKKEMFMIESECSGMLDIQVDACEQMVKRLKEELLSTESKDGKTSSETRAHLQAKPPVSRPSEIDKEGDDQK